MAGAIIGSRGEVVCIDDFTGGKTNHFELFGEEPVQTYLDVVNGGTRLQTKDNTDNAAAGLQTKKVFQPSKNYAVDFEARLRIRNEHCDFFFGFADDGDQVSDLLTAASATVLTPVASDYVGFYHEASIDDATGLLAVYRGGVVNAPTDVTKLKSTKAIRGSLAKIGGADLGDYVILRARISQNGRLNLWADDQEIQTVEDGVNPETLVKAVVAVQSIDGNSEAWLDVEVAAYKCLRAWK